MLFKLANIPVMFAALGVSLLRGRACVTATRGGDRRAIDSVPFVPVLLVPVFFMTVLFVLVLFVSGVTGAGNIAESGIIDVKVVGVGRVAKDELLDIPGADGDVAAGTCPKAANTKLIPSPPNPLPKADATPPVESSKGIESDITGAAADIMIAVIFPPLRIAWRPPAF